MPSAEDLRKWARRGSAKPRQSEPAAPAAAAPPAPAAALPPLPAGFVYAYSPQAGGYVPVVDPRLPVAPAPQPVPQPAAVSWAPMYAQPGMPGSPMPGAPRAAPIRTSKLVRPGDRDPYAELLAQTPELTPQQAGHFFQGLTPTADDVGMLMHAAEANPENNYRPPVPADPMGRVSVSEDPSQDAFPRGVRNAPIVPLRELAPGAAPATE